MPSHLSQGRRRTESAEVSAQVVGISDCKISWDPGDLLITYALGSCIAVALYDPVAKIGGLLHYMLPDSALDAAKAQANPFMFADTGIPRLIAAVRSKGASPGRLVVRLAGGAQVLDSHGTFQIGKRNYLAARRILWKAGVLIAAEAVGGEVSRTTRLEIATGRMWIREGGGADCELAPHAAPRKTMEGKT
jgi:chemotaxis protein CheD